MDESIKIKLGEAKSLMKSYSARLDELRRSL